MKIDEQDFDELRELLEAALQANYEVYNCMFDDPYNPEKIAKANDMEHRLWIKFNDMRDAVKNTPLHDIINNERNNK